MMANEDGIHFKGVGDRSGIVSVRKLATQVGYLDDQGNLHISGYVFAPADLQKIAERGNLVAAKMNELINP